MQNFTFKLLIHTAFMVVIGFVIGMGVVVIKIDPLDVNRDGEANLVDLSVLAAELNARNAGN